jgi:hypothetical protein
MSNSLKGARPHSRRARLRARVMCEPPSKEEGAGNARCMAAPIASYAIVKKHTSKSTTGKTGASAFPAQWFTSFCALSPVSMTLLVTVALRNVSHDLTPAKGRQDHTPSPSASMSHVRRQERVHRIPRSTFGDDWPNVPLAEAGWPEDASDLGSESTYFLKFGSRLGFENCHWIEMSDEIGRSARRRLSAEGVREA